MAAAAVHRTRVVWPSSPINSSVPIPGFYTKFTVESDGQQSPRPVVFIKSWPSPEPLEVQRESKSHEQRPVSGPSAAITSKIIYTLTCEDELLGWRKRNSPDPKSFRWDEGSLWGVFTGLMKTELKFFFCVWHFWLNVLQWQFSL